MADAVLSSIAATAWSSAYTDSRLMRINAVAWWDRNETADLKCVQATIWYLEPDPQPPTTVEVNVT